MEESFLTQFAKMNNLYKERIFIHEVQTKKDYSYQEFFLDTVRTCYYIQTKFTDKKVIVLSAKNSYRFAVYIMAVILSGKKLFLINPEENKTNLLKLLSQISDDYSILGDDFFVTDVTHIKFANLENLTLTDNYFPTGPTNDQDLIYIPTSATTGQSKIVVQKEAAIIANIKALIKHHHLSHETVIGTPLPLFHVNALHFSFMCTFFTGGTLILFQAFDLKNTFLLINEKNIQILSVIPPILSAIARNFEMIANIKIDCLRYFVSAAAPLSIETAAKIRALLGKRIIQGYGLSESVNFTCLLPIDLSDELYNDLMTNYRFPSIGISLEETEIILKKNDFIIEDDLIEGEIHIRGPSLMPGYLNTPSGPFFSDGFLKTGDIGFKKTIGNQKYYFIAGRIKENAKINGESISLRELDETLMSFKRIEFDFITTSFENEFRGEEIALVCQVSSTANLEKSFEDIKDLLLNIDSNIRPKVIVFSASLSIRTPSGKAKRWIFKEPLKYLKSQRLLNSILRLDI